MALSPDRRRALIVALGWLISAGVAVVVGPGAINALAAASSGRPRLP